MTEARLFLGPVAADFDATRDIAAGPWCFLNTPQGLLAGEALSYVDPFVDETILEQTRGQAHALTEYVIRRWAERLQQRHRVEHSMQFWRLILATWACELSVYVLMRWRLIEALATAHGDRPLTVPVYADDRRWRFGTVAHFIAALNHAPAFGWWVTSRVAQVAAPSHWQLRSTAPATGSLPSESDDIGLPRNMRGHLRTWLKYALHWADIDSTPRQKLQATLLGLPRLPPPRRTPLQPLPFPPDLPQAMEPLLLDLMERTAPAAYDGSFMALRAWSGRVPAFPGKIRFGVMSRWNDVEKMVWALARERGEHLCTMQHGGGSYGVYKAAPAADVIEYALDGFITWGWTGQSDYRGNFIPLPVPRLSALADSHTERTPSLILVGAPIRTAMTRLNSEPRPQHYYTYLAAKRSFTEGLEPAPRAALAYRPYRHAAADIDDGAYMQERFTGLELVDGNLDLVLMRCRLLVLDHNSTTLHVALAANVPTLCYWDPDFFRLCPEAQAAFDGLAAVNILHTTPEAAARHVNAVWHDVAAWWTSAAVQEARRRWVAQHAATSSNWRRDWRTALPAGIRRGLGNPRC